MLTPEYLDGIAAPLQELYGQLETDILTDIARRIKTAGRVTSTAEWQIKKLEQIGASQSYIRQRIAATLGAGEGEINDLFTAAGIKTCAKDEATRKAAVAAGKRTAGVPLTATETYKRIMQIGMGRTKNTLRQLTGTMATDAAGKLNKYLDRAHMMTESGAFTIQQATDTAVNGLVSEGVTAFDYASGVRTSVEAAVQRALVTSVNQTTAEISIANAAELETDLVEVTSHADSRPEHAVWQGGVYSLTGSSKKHRKLSEATGYGTAGGLCGVNCRHSFYAFIEGVSEQLPKETYDPATYAAEQRQRYNERRIREWKRNANTLRAGGVDATKAEQRVAFWQAKQRDHVNKYGLARMYDREKVYGMTAPTPRPRRPILTPAAPTPEELAAAKRDKLKAESRERTRRWREAKKAEAIKAAAARAAAETAAKEAAERAAREAAEAAARETAAREAAATTEAERRKAASRERTRKWREAKKAAPEAPAAPAAPAVVETPITAFDKRVGGPGTYKVYRSTSRTIPADGITAFHGRIEDAAGVSDLSTVREYHLKTEHPYTVEADTKGAARAKAFKGLTGESPDTYPGALGPRLASSMRTDGYDSIIYKMPDGHVEVDPISFDMAKETPASEEAVKKAREAAEKAKREAEHRAELAARETAKREAVAAAEKAKREAVEKAKREAEAKAIRQSTVKAKGDLKAPRGPDGKTAPTLRNFDGYRDKQVKSKFKDPPDQLEKAKSWVQQAVDSGVPRKRISQEHLKKTLTDGRFTTQIELEYDAKHGRQNNLTSGGMLNPAARKKASTDLFGTPYREIPATEFENYGYLWDPDHVDDFEWDGPCGYGSSTVTYKPEVRHRVTLTCGDSLGRAYIPSYLDDVTPCWRPSDGYGGNRTEKLAKMFDTKSEPSVRALYEKVGSGYIELQYHGSLTLDDVESFVVGPREMDRHGLDKELAEELNKRGIKVGYVKYDRATNKNSLHWLTEEELR